LAWLILACFYGQVAPVYQRLHQTLFPLVADTIQRTWLSRLRTEMEKLRKVEWNDRFFREVATLYLEAPEEGRALLDSFCQGVGARGMLLQRLWQTLADREASPDYLIGAWQALRPLLKQDTTIEGAIGIDLIAIGEVAVEGWLPTGAPLSPLVEASWNGYLRGLWAAYRFIGFRESAEPWRTKLHLITAMGLLDYYSYAEAANRYRAWKRGYWP
jgi:hypothetical protein